MGESAERSLVKISPKAAGLVATLVLTVLVPAVVVGTARQDRASTVERAAPFPVVVLGLGGCAAIVVSAWLLWAQHPYVCAGLAVLVAGLMLPSVAGWASVPTPLRAEALAAGPLAVAGIAIAHERWAHGRPGAFVLIASSLTVAAVVVRVVGYDPFKDPSCTRLCAADSPIENGLVSTHVAVVAAHVLTVAACAVAGIASGRQRQTRPPPLVTAGAVAAFVVLGWSSAERATSWADGRQSALAVVLPTVVVAFTIGSTMLVPAMRSRRTRVAVERLATRLAEPESALLGSTVREIHFAVPGDGRWVDATGRNVETVLEGECVVVPDESGPALRLLVRRRTDAAEVVAAFTPAARLTLTNARLAAVTLARLSDVTASRRRVVATADDERRRIERDLHDGSQQRLVSAAFHLSVARGGLADAPAELLSAEHSLRDALAQLRELAHGMFPTVITTEGLRPALEDLVRASEVAATLEMAADCTVTDEVALAVYSVVVATLDALAGSHEPYARVSVLRQDPLLIARLSTGRLNETDLIDAADRVGAAGGRLSISFVDHETTVTAEFPCV